MKLGIVLTGIACLSHVSGAHHHGHQHRRAHNAKLSARDGGWGVTYSPYWSTGECRSAENVKQDFEAFRGIYSTIRLYGVDCEMVGKALPAADAIGAKLMLGIYDLGDKATEQANKLIAAVNGQWGLVHSVSVGNELVNTGKASVGDVTTAVGAVRNVLRKAGFSGPVVTVDTFNAVLANPALCEASDFCAINCHPFFDPNTSADQAGEFLATQVQNVKAVVGDKAIYITETGWPWQGAPNGLAVPSLENQKKALDSIMKAYPGSKDRIFFFASFNEKWKKAEDATFHAEQFWGINGADYPSGV